MYICKMPPAAVEALDKQLGFVGRVEYAEVERLCAKIAMELKSMHIGGNGERKTVWYRPMLEKDAVLADYCNQNEQLPL